MGGSSGIAIVDDLNPIHAGGTVNRAVESEEGHILTYTAGAVLGGMALTGTGVFAPAAAATAETAGGVGAANASLAGGSYLTGAAAETSTAGYLGAATDLGYGAASVAPTVSADVFALGAANSYDLAAAVGSPSVAAWSGVGNAAAAASNAAPGFWQTAATTVGTGLATGIGARLASGLANGGSSPAQYANPANSVGSPGGAKAPTTSRDGSGQTVLNSPAAKASGLSLPLMAGVIALVYFIKKSKH